MKTIESLKDNTVILTFRNLSPSIKEKLNMQDIFRILSAKNAVYSSMTYSEKCTVTFEKLVVAVQKRLKRRRVRIARDLVRKVLKAEEKYYLQISEELLDAELIG